jgi:metallo-beta-lactamase class B
MAGYCTKVTSLALGMLICCGAVSAQEEAGMGAGGAQRDISLEAQAREPFQIFDNLYFVGIEFVASFLITTSDGLILIDTLYGDKGYGDYLFNNIRSLGFNPEDLEYVVVTHGHRDHYGGARELQERTDAIIGAAEEDWTLIESDPDNPAPQRDWVIEQDDTLILGDTVLRFDITPGHTPGVVSIEFTVFDQGREHKAYLHGGSAPRTSEPAGIREFLDGLERVKAIEDIEVRIANHPFIDNLFERAEALARRQPGEAHPFVAPEAFYAWIDELITDTEESLE